MVGGRSIISKTGAKTFIGGALCFALVFVFTYINRRFELDDALIYFRYFDNFLQGHGLVYNLGEKFNGLTSPIYTYLSLLCGIAVKDIQISQMFLSGMFLFLLGLGMGWLVKSELKSPIAWTIPLLPVTSFYFYFSFGMETTLFSFLTVLVLYYFERGDYFWLGIISVLLILTRGEGALLLLVLTAFHFIERRPFPSWKCFVLPVILLCAHYSFNAFYYGHLLPETLSVKIGQGKSGLWGLPPIFLHEKKAFLRFYFGEKPYLLALIALVAVMGFTAIRKSRLLQIAAVYFVLYNAFYILLNIPNHPWYYSYDFVFLYLLLAFGLDRIWEVLSARLKHKALGLGAVLGIAVIILALQAGLTYSRVKDAGPFLPYKSIGVWLRENTPPETKVATVEIGSIGWHSKRYIIDILGLVNLYNADFIARRQFDKWLEFYTPDYIVAHTPLWSHECSIKPLMESGKYVPEPKFNLPGYLLLKKADSQGSRASQ